MKNFIAMLACAMLSLISVPALAQKDLPPPTPVVQTPCQVPGFTHQKACVVGAKIVPNTEPTWWAQIKRSEARPIIGKQREFSVIHLYTLGRSPNGNDSAGLFVSDASTSPESGGVAMGEISRGQKIMYWITTHDGGRTWDQVSSAPLNQ